MQHDMRLMYRYIPTETDLDRSRRSGYSRISETTGTGSDPAVINTLLACLYFWSLPRETFDLGENVSGGVHTS